jgi:hypothetical protein
MYRSPETISKPILEMDPKDRPEHKVRYKRATRDTERAVHETGEIVTTTKSFSIETTAEDFFLCFLDNLGSLFQLTNATDIHMLAWLCSKCQLNTTQSSVSTADRNHFMEKLGISTQAFSNSIGRLKKLGLITGEKGTFTINPDVLWRGSVKERNKWMRGEGMKVMIDFRSITDKPTTT